MCGAACALMLLAGCSDSNTAKKAPSAEKPAEPLTGQVAIYRMYSSARSALGADVQPLRMHSIRLPEVKSEPAKAAAWEATFVAQQSGRARNYTYSVVESEGNLHKGVFAGPETSWSGPQPNAKPFLMAAIKVDSDAAYQTALKKAADYSRKNPNMNISFLLESNARFPDPVWRVIWGESVSTSNFSIFVDATTGQYLETMR